MTERSIQMALYWRFRSTARLMVPNYNLYPRWFECDLLRVTKAGYAHEFEIKRTISDFKADAHKSCGRTKHDRLAAGDNYGPSRFTFVMPEDMVALADVPTWAGLIYARPYAGMPGKLILKVVRPAPRLHQVKVSEETVTKMMVAICYRFWADRDRQVAKQLAEETP